MSMSVFVFLHERFTTWTRATQKKSELLLCSGLRECYHVTSTTTSSSQILKEVVLLVLSLFRVSEVGRSVSCPFCSLLLLVIHISLTYHDFVISYKYISKLKSLTNSISAMKRNQSARNVNCMEHHAVSYKHILCKGYHQYQHHQRSRPSHHPDNQLSNQCLHQKHHPHLLQFTVQVSLQDFPTQITCLHPQTASRCWISSYCISIQQFRSTSFLTTIYTHNCLAKQLYNKLFNINS